MVRTLASICMRAERKEDVILLASRKAEEEEDEEEDIPGNRWNKHLKQGEREPSVTIIWHFPGRGLCDLNVGEPTTSTWKRLLF